MSGTADSRKRERRLPLYPPLLEAFEAGVLCFWVVAPRGGRSRNTCVLVPRPHLRVESGTLHSWDSPAVDWPGSTRYWFWRGIRI